MMASRWDVDDPEPDYAPDPCEDCGGCERCGLAPRFVLDFPEKAERAA